MKKALTIISFCLFFQQSLMAMISPANGAKLNYRQIMFEYDQFEGTDYYMVHVASKSYRNTSLALIISDFEFGKSYTWYYEAFKDDKSIFKSEQYNFSINNSYLIDPALFRSIVNTPYKGDKKNEIFFLDYRGIAVDRDGKPIWFYPYNASSTEQDPNFRNLRMTSEGSIILIDDSSCYEIDRDAKRLWIAPNDGKISGEAKEFYHHDFMKMPDGSYLTSGYKYRDEPNLLNPSVQTKVRYNTLIQYSKGRQILWSWDEKDHVPAENIWAIYGAQDMNIAGTHLNAFDYNAKDDAIMISCRHNSSIIKVDKKTGKLIYTLGLYGNKEKAAGIVPPFLHQHGMSVLPGGRFLLYDNNAGEVVNPGVTYPRVMIIQEPKKGNEVNKVWEFECVSKRFPRGIFGKGGYAAPLPNENILVCMGGANYIFEVTPAKEVIWECSFEKHNSATGNWDGFINYRSSYASSLYPHHFTVEYGPREEKSIMIDVNNEGTEPSSHTIQVVAGGETEIFLKTISLSGRTSQRISIPVKKKYAGKKINVTVSGYEGYTGEARRSYTYDQ